MRPRLDDRSDLFGLLALALYGILAAAAGLLPDGAMTSLLDIAFVVFGYATVRALDAPEPDSGPGTDAASPTADDPAAPAPDTPTGPPPNPASLLTGLLAQCHGPLMVVLLASLGASAALLPAAAVEWLAISGLASAALVSNLLFAAAGGSASAVLPHALHHTWAISLAAQWAVLLVALALLLVRSASLKPLMIALAVLALASVAATPALPGGLDMTLLRLFPFATGGLLVALDKLYWQHTLLAHLMREALLVAGLGLIAAALAWDSTGSGRWLAAADGTLATLGTAAIVFARGAPTLGHLLTNRVLRWLGAAAFTTYLLHGPVFALSAVALPDAATHWLAAEAALASLAGGSLLHLANRALPAAPAERVWALALAGAFAVAALAALLLYGDGALPLSLSG